MNGCRANLGVTLACSWQSRSQARGGRREQFCYVAIGAFVLCLGLFTEIARRPIPLSAIAVLIGVMSGPMDLEYSTLNRGVAEISFSKKRPE